MYVINKRSWKHRIKCKLVPVAVGVKSLAQGPKWWNPCMIIGFEPATIQSLLRSLNPQSQTHSSYMSLSEVGWGVPSLLRHEQIMLSVWAEDVRNMSVSRYCHKTSRGQCYLATPVVSVSIRGSCLCLTNVSLRVKGWFHLRRSGVSVVFTWAVLFFFFNPLRQEGQILPRPETVSRSITSDSFLNVKIIRRVTYL